ncbi:TPA: sugar transferase [Clostridium perfringens]|uniref:sugar transferase n=2 Tax=Clostridium perfringens TaxID=1502 RepID=UPI000D5230A9|nr:sugar transferase [Clostridium perfringens]EIF6296514.1 sugar transferase [Clostridium perfringens]EIF6298191.1 sugar transferase [Clostridium perfringens]ELC8404877.1 sugar transferase [Clostridium perfringens]ELC8405854.1 sugar transferase [Clostridium perfringens]PVE16595.1 lipid carrier--UDP-N-acetylgalactosaminyltransferase [Clostridium perfringens]
MKRVFDFSMSLIAIIVFSPIILIISLLVKLTSKGPVFFKQRRIGKNNEEFNILKFRSMRIDTPNVATHLLKDPSVFITPLGKFLRKTSLDELPQLINILKGEMSIVGPRPALYNQYDLKDMRTKVGVHKLVPGLTGWAQINGRDEIPLEEKVALDKEYMIMQSFWMDIKIIFMTIFKVAKSEGVSEGSTKGGCAKSTQKN